MTASYARDRIAVMLGGRVSERLIFGEVSSAPRMILNRPPSLPEGWFPAGG